MKKSRVGLTPTPAIQEKDRAYVMFMDLIPDPKIHMVDFLLKEYLEPRHNHQIIDTVDHSDRNMVIVQVKSKEIGEHWEEIYSKKLFNGRAPKIQLIK